LFSNLIEFENFTSSDFFLALNFLMLLVLYFVKNQRIRALILFFFAVEVLFLLSENQINSFAKSLLLKG